LSPQRGTEAKSQHEEANAEDGNLLPHLELTWNDLVTGSFIRTVCNIVITVDQYSTLVKEVFIETHYEGGAGDADGCARDAKHGDPPAYEGRLLRIFLRVEGDFVRADRRIVS
jgi:hypothetical protein